MMAFQLVGWIVPAVGGVGRAGGEAERAASAPDRSEARHHFFPPLCWR